MKTNPARFIGMGFQNRIYPSDGSFSDPPCVPLGAFIDQCQIKLKGSKAMRSEKYGIIGDPFFDVDEI